MARAVGRINCWLGLGLALGMFTLAFGDAGLAQTKRKPKSGGPKYHLVTVGINDYKDSFFTPLQFAELDAERVSRSFGQGTRYEVVRYDLRGAEATTGKILAALRKAASRAQSRDVLGIYVSGHGTIGRDRDGDLVRMVVTHDTAKNQLGDTALPQALIRKILDRSRASRRFAIFASCHSGIGKSRLTPPIQQLLAGAKGDGVVLEEVSEGTLVLSAAARGETAFESKKLKGDIYTHYLLKGVETADSNEDGAVALRELHDFAKERTFRHTEGKQRPTLESQMIGDADIPVVGRRKEPGLPVLTGYSEQWADLDLRVKGGDNTYLPGAVALNPGVNVVEIRSGADGPVIGRYRVEAKQGERLSLDQLASGHPWAIDLRIARGQWQSERLQALTGTDTMMALVLAAEYRWARWFVGGGFHSVQTLEEPSPQPGVEARVEQSNWQVHGGAYWRLWSHTLLRAELGLGQEAMNVILAVPDASDRLELTSTAATWRVGASLIQQLPSNIRLQGGLYYQDAQHDLGEGRNLDGRRIFLEFGGGYEFGGVGTRL